MKIYIEANIGAGKSTFLRLLNSKKFTNLKLVQEPVDEWMKLTDENNINILDHFYQNQKRWSFAFQMNSFISRSHKVNQAEKDKLVEIIIVERSVFTDKYCFAQNCYDSGNMSKIEWDIYNKWHSWLVDSFNLNPDAYIYLKTSPEICFQRIKKRNRNGESDIPLEYLELLHKKHEEWMENEKNNLPILTINTNEDFTNNDNLSKIIEQLNTFISQHFNITL